MQRLSALDGLRAVAVLAVVAYHAGLPVPAGFVGVDVFFVISGYLITRLLADEVRATGRIDFMHFYARRARRILPAAVLVVVVTLALSFLLPTGRAEVAESAAAASVFGANFYFQAVTGGYWDASAESMPLLHLWSLSVEEQFYLLWPLLLLAVRKAPMRWLVAVAVASFVLAEALMYSHPQAAFYQMPARAWELAAGGIVALMPAKLESPSELSGRHISGLFVKFAAPAGLLLTLAACFVPLPHFPGVGALPAVAGATLLIAGIHAGQSVRVLESRPVVYVGLISYSLYLWHWPLLAIDRASRVGDAPLSVRLALCAAAFVLAALSYRYVEQPFRRSRASPRKAVAVGLACVALVSCVGLVGASTTEPKPSPPVAFDRCPPFNPTAPEAVNPSCVKSGRRVVIGGDSMSYAWQSIALQHGTRLGIPVVTFSHMGCPPALNFTMPVPDKRQAKTCRKRNDELFAYIVANKPEVLVLGSRWGSAQKWCGQEAFDDAFIAFVQAASPHVGRIVVVGPSPELKDTPEKCTALGVDCGITWDDYLVQSEMPRKLMARAAETPNVDVLEVAAWLCAEGHCPQVRDGHPLYTDTHHVDHAVAESFSSQMR